MKKTVTYLALAATSVLFLTACSNNNQESTNTFDELDVFVDS